MDKTPNYIKKTLTEAKAELLKNENFVFLEKFMFRN